MMTNKLIFGNGAGHGALVSGLRQPQGFSPAAVSLKKTGDSGGDETGTTLLKNRSPVR